MKNHCKRKPRHLRPDRQREAKVVADRILQDWLRHKCVLPDDAVRLAEIILGQA